MNILLFIIALLVLLLLLALAYEAFSAMRDRQRYKTTPPGELVDVGGHRLHMLVMGEREAGKPAVVLDAGAGGNVLDWQLVQPRIGEFAQAVSYDRAGYGWSDKGSDPRSPSQIVEELHSLLHNAHIEPPYVLVGHSFGGVHVQAFAGQYPDEVAGLVLVDSSHPAMIQEQDTEAELRRLRTVSRFKRVGLVRWMLPRILNRAKYLPEEQRKQYLALNLLDSDNVIREAMSLFRASVELPDEVHVPLTVISRAYDEDLSGEREWHKYQQMLRELSPAAKHIIAETSSHYIALAEPETVIEAVREMVERSD